MADVKGDITVINRTEAGVMVCADRTGVVSGHLTKVNPGATVRLEVSGYPSYTVAFYNSQYAGSQYPLFALRANGVIPPAIVTLSTTVGMRPGKQP